MLDIKFIRENLEVAKERIKYRGDKYITDLDNVIELDKSRRSILTKLEDYKSQKNDLSKEVGMLKRDGKDASSVIGKVEEFNDEIEKMELELGTIESGINDILIMMPNMLHETVPYGESEEDNVVVKTYGEIPTFDFEVKPHYEIGVDLDILDFEAAARIVGSRFVVLKKDAARLERALIAFMIDVHTLQHGYTEVIPPYIVNRQTMLEAGKLPKFEDDAFKFFNDTDWFLNSTAEVPLTGYFSNQVINEDELPVNIVGYTTAFRREAGSAGRDTRGILRQHQFNKVELFKVASPNDSYDQLELMLQNAEKILQILELPYRVVSLCTSDMGEGSTKTYDIEVWIPSQNKYREISSVSNTESYQALRANIKIRKNNSKKLEVAHLLNGSGIAVGRTMIAIMENYQNADGTITIPKALLPYMAGVEVIKK